MEITPFLFGVLVLGSVLGLAGVIFMVMTLLVPADPTSYINSNNSSDPFAANGEGVVLGLGEDSGGDIAAQQQTRFLGVNVDSSSVPSTISPPNVDNLSSFTDPPKVDGISNI